MKENKEKIDICPICEKEINLALLHAYDRDLGKPVHLSCVVNRTFNPEDGVPF